MAEIAKIDGIVTKYKKCRKCAEVHALSNFYIDKNKRDGLTSMCKACTSARVKEWKALNPEKVKSCNAAYQKANPEKQNAYVKNWRAVNRDRVRAIAAASYKANRVQRIASALAYKDSHPEVIRIHSQNRRARKLVGGGQLSKGLSAKLFKLQKGKCPCCKQPLGDDYHLDHVMPLALGGTNTDDNIQLLRSTCNLKKHARHPVEFMQSMGFLF